MPHAPFDLVDARDTFADSEWFHTCRQAQAPYVVVRSGETSADVLWDYVTLPPCCDAALRGNFTVLENRARAIFDRFAIPESHLRVKPTLICFDRLPFDHAKRAATELHRLISSFLPGSPDFEAFCELDSGPDFAPEALSDSPPDSVSNTGETIDSVSLKTA